MEDTDNSRVEENMEEECENNTSAENEPSDVDDAGEEQTETTETTDSNGQNNVDEEVTAEEVVEEEMETECPPPRLMITKMVRFIFFYVCCRPYQSLTTINIVNNR